MDDLISRQEAIDALEKVATLFPWKVPGNSDTYDRYNEAWNDAIGRAEIEIEKLPSAQPENTCENTCEIARTSNDCVSRQAAIDALDGNVIVTSRESAQAVMDYIRGCADRMRSLPSAQPERTCVNCGRTVNNGGWYADGRTRCPIEEHYALPKDGFCHLWEKRNVTDEKEAFEDEINAEPTIEERKTGKWIKKPEFCGDDVSGFIDNHFSCSECKKEAEINSWGFYILSDFCPHCGARLVQEGEEP